MDQEISKIIQELAAQESKLQSELDETSCKARAIADQLEQVQTALAALQGISTNKAAKSDTKTNRPTATASEVENAVASVLRQRGNLSKSDVLSAVKSQILSKGRSRVGLKTLFAKAITSSRFKIDQNEIVSIA